MAQLIKIPFYVTIAIALIPGKMGTILKLVVKILGTLTTEDVKAVAEAAEKGEHAIFTAIFHDKVKGINPRII